MVRVVERMHGTFKSILGKCSASGLDWVGQINYVLFVLRQMPHADSEFSPFDLVYGFRVRTPLEALYTMDCTRWKVRSWECVIG